MLHAAVAANLGWIDFQRSVSASPPRLFDAPPVESWFGAANLAGAHSDFPAERQIIAALTRAMQPEVSSFAVEADRPRQMVKLLADLKLAVVLTDEANADGRIAQARALRLSAGVIAQTLVQLAPEPVTRHWEWQELYRLVGLSQKADRPDLVDFWLARVRANYPDAGHAYLYSLTDPYAQSALADAYASLDMLPDALRVGEQALLIHHWDWGHFMIAGYYRRVQRSDEAERHLLAAISLAGSDSIRNRYRMSLADLYQQEGLPDRDIQQLCLVIDQSLDPQDSDAQGAAKAQLMALRGTTQICDGVRP